MSGEVVLALRLLLVLILYSFLGLAFVYLWRDIKQQGDLLALRKVPPINLTIFQGDHHPQSRQFVQMEVTIGRDPVCECLVDDDAISAQHARLSFHHNQWWLEDLGSTNGSILNREKLTTPTVVISEDEFICGSTRFIISILGGIVIPPSMKY